MDSLTWLLCLCFAMFGGAFGSGYIPLIFSMSENKLRLITIFGAGLLVGTALIVIIPEGVAMHYEGQQKHQHLNTGWETTTTTATTAVHPLASSATSVGSSNSNTEHHHPHRLLLDTTTNRIVDTAIESLTSTLSPSSSSSTSSVRRRLGDETLPSSPSDSFSSSSSSSLSTVATINPLSTTALIETTLATAEHAAAQAEEEEITHQHPGHWEIGAALAIGFAFQLIIDRLSGGLHSHPSHSSSVVVTTPTSSSSSSTGNDPSSSSSSSSSVSSSVSVTDERNVRANNGGDHSAKSKSAMVGMVVHAIVDGVALGAAVREGDSTLGFIVFLAIMLHKAPSSFGLSSYLLHHGISHEGVKKRLLLFSSAAPFGAIFTYTLLTINLFTYKQEMLARCLLFSGGTFLYVATAHVLPEIQNGHTLDTHDDKDVVDADEENGHSHSHHHHHHHRTPPKMKWSEIWIMVGGVLLPLLLDVHHGH